MFWRKKPGDMTFRQFIKAMRKKGYDTADEFETRIPVILVTRLGLTLKQIEQMKWKDIMQYLAMVSSQEVEISRLIQVKQWDMEIKA